MQLAVPDSTGQRSPSGWQPGMEQQVHKAPGDASFYQTPPGALIAAGDSSAPHIGVLPTSLPIPLHTPLPVVSASHALGPPQSVASALPSTSAAPPPAESSAQTSLITRKKYSGKVLSPEEWQQYYEKLNNQRSFAMANPGKGAWFWEHLEPQLVRGSDGVTLAVKLHCRCCGLILGASNPSRTAAEHLRSGACPNFQKDGAPEPPRKKRVRVPMGIDGAHMAALDPEAHDLVVDPGRLPPPVPQLPSTLMNTGAPYTYLANLFTEIQPPSKGILSHTIRSDQQLRLMLLGFAQGEEMSIPMYAAPYKASATLFFLSGEADVFLGADTLKVYQGAMVHITADVTHTVRAITPMMLMASIMRY